MGLIDSGSKSSRLLASRRYTHNTYTTAQESFTEVLDLGASEIYTQANKIPSSGLPFSGSSQKSSNYAVNSENILKYWYRQKLTKSNVNNEVWFFLNPTGSNSGIGAQLIDDNQQTNFVSPKYSVASLANSTTEDDTPGYLAVLYKSTSTDTSSLDSDDIVSTNDYQFDYKTGVVQFMNSNVDPGDSDYVYMTVNQYVGKTLETGVEVTGDVSGSVSSTGSFASLQVSDKVQGTLTVAGDTTLQSDLSVVDINASGHITASSNISASGDLYATGTGSFGHLIIADGGDIELDNDQRIYFESDDGTYIESDGTDRLRSVVGGSQMLLLDQDDGRVNIGYGHKLGVGLGNNTTPGVELEVVRDISGSGTGSFSRLEASGYINIDGTSNLQGDVTLQNDLSVSGHVTASNNISASGNLSATGNLDIDGNADIAGYITASGNIGTAGNLYVTGNTDIDGTSNLQGDVTLQNDLLVSGHITASGNISSSGNIYGTGNLDIDGTANIAGDVNMQSDLDVTGTITAREIHTVFVSASVATATGSNVFGDDGSDEHQFTGSIQLSGSVGNESYLIGHKVGIGTTDPDQSFHIYDGSDAGIRIEGNAGDAIVEIDSGGANNDSYVDFKDDGTMKWRIKYDSSNTGTVPLLFQDAAETDIVALDGSNNRVGILTAAPTEPLTVTGNISASGALMGVTHITASGNVSSSGNLYVTGNTDIDGTLDVDGLANLDDVDVDGYITASGNIGTDGNLYVTGNADINGTTNLDDVDVDGYITASGNIGTDSKLFVTGTSNLVGDVTLQNDLSVSGHITASNNISASGNLSATGNLDIDGNADIAGYITASGNLGTGGNLYVTGNTDIDGTSNLEGDVTLQNDLLVSGHITASNNISASGNIYGTGNLDIDGTANIAGDTTLQSDLSAVNINATGNITASGEISASGTVYVNSDFPQLKLSDDGYADYITLGMSGDIGYFKTSDQNNDFKFRRSDNFDIIHLDMSAEKTQISGSGGLSVIGHVTSSGNISASGNLSATGNLDIDGNTDVAGYITASGNLGAGGNIYGTGNLDIDGTADFASHITASGNISSSGNLYVTGELDLDGASNLAGNIDFGGNISGSTTSSGSFGRIDINGDIYANGRIYESGTSVVDHATAMAIVFGG